MMRQTSRSLSRLLARYTTHLSTSLVSSTPTASLQAGRQIFSFFFFYKNTVSFGCSSCRNCFPHGNRTPQLWRHVFLPGWEVWWTHFKKQWFQVLVDLATHTHTHTVTMVTADTPWVANLSEIQPCRAAGAPPLQCSQTNSRCFNSEAIKRYSLHAAQVVFPQQQQVTVKLVTLLEELEVCIPSPSAHPTAHCSRDWMFPYCGEKY